MRWRVSSATQTDARLGRIIRLLNDYATVVVSGTKIADEIGTTRSEVWRLVQQLRSLGVAIEGHPATGYRLHAMPDLLLPEVLSPLVRSTVFSQHIRHYFKMARPTLPLCRQRAKERLRAPYFWLNNKPPAKAAAGTPGIRRIQLEFIVQ